MRRTLGAVIVLLLLLGMVSPAVTADLGGYNSLAMFITYPYGDHEVGSRVNVTVHVLNGGEYFDPDGVSLEVRASGRTVDLTRVSTGVYNGSFVIEWDDLEGYLYVALEGDVDMSSGYGVGHTAFIMTVYSRFQVSYVWLEPAEGEIEPGRKVTLEARTTYGGQLVDPDPGSLRVGFHDVDVEGDPPDLDTTKVAVGRYRASYTIPDDVTSSMVFEVGASANLTLTIPTAHGDEEYTTSSGAWRTYGLDLLEVWGNVRGSSSDEVLVDLHVRDGDGLPVAGADVSVVFSYMSGGWTKRAIGSDDGPTDGNGTVPFIIDLSNVTGDVVLLWAEGNVTHGNISQEIHTIVPLSASQGAGSVGGTMFRVDRIDEVLDYDDGTHWGKYRALSYGEPLARSDIYVYVVTDYEVIDHINTSTDASGFFEFEYDLPETVEFGHYPGSYPTTYYHALVNGSWTYVEESRLIQPVDPEEMSIPAEGPQTALDVGTAAPGENLTIEFHNTLADGTDEVGTVLWGLTDLPFGIPGPREWSRWTPSPAWDAGGYLECEWTGEGYATNLTVPGFLPVGTEMLIVPWLTLLNVSGGDVMGPSRWVTLSEEIPEPTAIITGPPSNSTVNGTVTVTGTSSGGRPIARVEYRVGTDDWQVAEGTSVWTFDVDTVAVQDDVLEVWVRSFDGSRYSDPVLLVLKVDQPPGSSVNDPTTWTGTDGTLAAGGLVWDDHENVVSVQVRVDGGDWVEVEVDEDGHWAYDLDTSALTPGEHTFVVRVFDGHQWSAPGSAVFEVRRPPTAVILVPVAGKVYARDFEFEGTSSADGQVTSVDIRIDGGEWQTVEGTLNWSHAVKVKDLRDGEHLLEVRAYDGTRYSETASVTFRVSAARDITSPENGSLFEVLVVVLIVTVLVVLAVGLHLVQRKRPRGP